MKIDIVVLLFLVGIY